MKTIVMSLALLLTGQAFAQVVSPPMPALSPQIMNPQNGHIYILINQAANWTDSEAIAVSLGGHLATIRNQEEEKWIEDVFFFYGYCWSRFLWTGLNDVQTPGQFVWASREPVTYTNWGAGQPSGIVGAHYAAIFGPPYPFSWELLPNGAIDPGGRQCNGVIEIIPNPEQGHSHNKDEKQDKDKKDKD